MYIYGCHYEADDVTYSMLSTWASLRKLEKTVTNSSPEPMLNNLCTGNTWFLSLANKDRKTEAEAELLWIWVQIHLILIGVIRHSVKSMNHLSVQWRHSILLNVSHSTECFSSQMGVNAYSITWSMKGIRWGNIGSAWNELVLQVYKMCIWYSGHTGGTRLLNND